MAAPVYELDQYDTFVLEILVEFVVLFLKGGDLVIFHYLLVLLEIVMVDVAIHEEILDLKSVHFLLVFQKF